METNPVIISAHALILESTTSVLDKHIEFTLFKLKKKRGAKKAFAESYSSPFSEIYLHYGLKREIMLREGKDIPTSLKTLMKKFFNSDKVLKDEQVLNFSQF